MYLYSTVPGRIVSMPEVIHYMWCTMYIEHKVGDFQFLDFGPFLS